MPNIGIIKDKRVYLTRQLLQNANINTRTWDASENHKHQETRKNKQTNNKNQNNPTKTNQKAKQNHKQIEMNNHCVIWACATGGLDLESRKKSRNPPLGVKANHPEMYEWWQQMPGKKQITLTAP